MIYHYHGGRFDWWISFERNNRKWALASGDSPNDEVWGSYSTPEQAASDLYQQMTGNDDWDMLPCESIPEDIQCIRNWEVYTRR